MGSGGEDVIDQHTNLTNMKTEKLTMDQMKPREIRKINYVSWSKSKAEGQNTS